MADPITIAQLIDASEDAQALSLFVNADAATQVPRRLANPVETLEYWRNYMSAMTKGADGIDAAITSMTVATGAAGTAASVVTGGTPISRTFALTIPRGDKGDKGIDGSFTVKAYTTYALMTADAANIPAQTSVNVTNDTDTTKNGLYTYNGTAFTKSAYDPKTYTDTAKADTLLKVQNVFATKALMTASTLPDGSNAQVNSDTTADNNGFYKKTAGVWAFTSYAPLTQAKAHTDSFVGSLTTTDAMQSRDLNNIVTLQQNKKGDIVLPKIGNLTAFVEKTQDFMFAKSTVDVDAVHFAGKYADYQIADNAAPFFQDFLVGNPQKVNDANIGSTLQATNSRISSFVRLSKYEFLVFYGAGYSGGDFGVAGEPGGKMVSAKITVDPVAKTIVTATPKLVNEGSIRNNQPYFWASISAVKLVSGRIVALVGTRAGSEFHEIFSMYSDDNGDTWSTPIDISYLKNDLGWNVVAFTFKGLVKRYGQHVGRIIMPMWTTQAGYSAPSYRSGYMYSDDNGATWNIGELLDVQYSNECTVCEDLNGDLLFNIRVEWPANYAEALGLHNKFFARHCDKTKKYTLLDTAKALSVERIMSGIYQGDNIYDHTPSKIMGSTCLSATRTGLGIHTSYDGCMTWTQYRPTALLNAPVGYTDVVSITADLAMVVYETIATNEIRACLVSSYNLINGEV